MISEKVTMQSFHDGQVARLTLNAPKANILDSDMMAGLDGLLSDLRDRQELKLLELTGAGDHFSFGASVQEHAREQAPAMLRQFHGLFHALIELAVPAAALVSGQCLGGGLELALMCNFLFADRSARLGQPEINLGVFAPPASLILPLKIGQHKADEMLLTGRSYTAEEAASMGLVTALFNDREAMLLGVDEWLVKNILPKSAAALRFAVRAARLRFNDLLTVQLRSIEALYLDRLMSTHDANEGIASFLEHRKPSWKNC
jgi:cyclohexa-1,5-dienecarbonyl-CoA hydratase